MTVVLSVAVIVTVLLALLVVAEARQRIKIASDLRDIAFQNSINERDRRVEAERVSRERMDELEKALWRLLAVEEDNENLRTQVEVLLRKRVQ